MARGSEVPGGASDVLMDRLSKSQLGFVFVAVVAALVTMTVAGAMGPDAVFAKTPVDGDSVPFNGTCNFDSMQKTVFTPNCWNHYFRFYHTMTQFFLVDFRPTNDLDEDAERELTLHVKWTGQKQEGDSAVDWEDKKVIADADVVRRTRCRKGERHCSPVVVFRANEILYDRFYFEVVFRDVAAVQTWSSRGHFKFVYENNDFSRYELAFKYTFAGITGAVLIAYLCFLRRATPDQRCFEHRWIALLLVTTLLFNNPLFGLQYSDGRAFFHVVGVIFDLAHLAALLLFLLVAFDGIAHDPPLSFKRFYLPKMLFVGSYWVIAMGMYLWVVSKEFSDPLFNWYEDRAVLQAAGVVSLVMAISYALLLVFYVVRATRHLGAMDARLRILYGVHLGAVLLTVVGVAAGFLVPSGTPRVAMEIVLVHGAFNLYAWLLAFLMLPSSGRDEFSPVGDDGVELRA